jgi:hypothetical protein
MISWTRRFNPNAFSRLFFSDRGSRTGHSVVRGESATHL